MNPVETAAIAPTLLQLAGFKDGIEKQFSVPALITSLEAPKATAYSETFYPFSTFSWSPLHSVQTTQYHYIDAPKPELYDVLADPDENNDLISQQPATAAVLRENLHTRLQQNPFKTSPDPGAALAPDAIENLQALGYVAYRSPVSAEALSAGLPDPKDKVEEFNSILAAEDAMRVGDYSTAESLLTRVQQQDPKMYIVPFTLGMAATKQKQWDRSAVEFKHCLELNPTFDQAMTALARSLYFLGKSDEAKQWAQNALKINSSNYKALYELASMESHTDKAAAIADYKGVLAIQSNFPLVWRDLGMLYFGEKNYAEAANHLAKAAELGVNEAPLYNFLGISYDRVGRVPEAIKSYHQALKLDDNLAEAHLNLGYAYHRQGHENLANREYQRACELKQDFCTVTSSGEKHN